MTTTSPQIALVTGARGGIGREVVAQLRQAGHRVAAVGRDAATVADVAADALIAADTTTPEGTAEAIAACIAQLGGPPTLLAHCVGSTLIAPLHRSTTAQYREVMRINLDSAFFMLQAWVEALRVAKLQGAAVLASSVVSRIGVANHEAIAAAKGGIEALARSAAATYAPLGLRVNVWTSILVGIGALVYLVVSARTRPGRETVLTRSPEPGAEPGADPRPEHGEESASASAPESERGPDPGPDDRAEPVVG